MALLALACKGLQDWYLFDAAHADTWDVRRKFLRDPYTTVYNKLPMTVEKRGTSFVFTLLHNAADMINDLDLVLKINSTLKIGSIIRGIHVHIGEQRIDSWEGTDIGTLIDTMCAIFNRKVSRHGDKLFLPLALAPFHSHNLLSLVGLKDQPIRITVDFVGDSSSSKSDSSIADAEIYGKMYFLSESPRKEAMSYDMGIAETQWGGDHPKGKYMSHTKHHLQFDHPISMLFFWGIDKATIQSVCLALNGHVFYDGPIEPLERIKEERGLGHVEPIIMFFSQEGFQSPYQSTVNFSRIDSATMVIGTKNTRNNTTIRYYAVAMHPLWVADGVCNKYFKDERSKNMFPTYGPTTAIEDI